MDDGGYAEAGTRHDRSADGFTEKCDDTPDDARSDNIEFTDVVNFQYRFAEACSHGWR